MGLGDFLQQAMSENLNFDASPLAVGVGQFLQQAETTGLNLANSTLSVGIGDFLQQAEAVGLDLANSPLAQGVGNFLQQAVATGLDLANSPLAVEVGNFLQQPGAAGLRYTNTPFAQTVTAVSTSLNPSVYGQLVTFTATVSPQIIGTPTGTVTFMDGSTTLGTGTLNGSGVVTFQTSALSVGSNTITAVYGGNADFTTSTSMPLVQTVIPGTPPTVSIAAVTPSLRVSPVGSITIQFSEPVVGFDLADLQLTRDGVTVPLNGATLTTSDQQNWTLGNLSATTSPVGNYQLTLAAAGSGITDFAGNPLTVGANITWQTVLTTTLTWDGGGGADNNWMTAANWEYDVAPVAGDQLIFAGATQTSTTTNFPAGTVFDSITFSNGGFTLTGNSVKLNPANGVAIDNVSGQNQINLPITSDSTGTTIVQAGTLELGPNAQVPVLSGSGTDIQGGSIVLDYTGAADPVTTVRSDLQSGLIHSSLSVARQTAIGYSDSGTAVTLRPDVIGDCNMDGTVNLADLNLFLNNYGKTSATWSMGDFNYDGVVNLADLNLLLNNYGKTVPPGCNSPLGGAVGAAGVAPVPEPQPAPAPTPRPAPLLSKDRLPLSPLEQIRPPSGPEERFSLRQALGRLWPQAIQSHWQPERRRPVPALAHPPAPLLLLRRRPLPFRWPPPFRSPAIRQGRA